MVPINIKEENFMFLFCSTSNWCKMFGVPPFSSKYTNPYKLIISSIYLIKHTPIKPTFKSKYTKIEVLSNPVGLTQILILLGKQNRKKDRKITAIISRVISKVS